MITALIILCALSLLTSIEFLAAVLLAARNPPRRPWP